MSSSTGEIGVATVNSRNRVDVNEFLLGKGKRPFLEWRSVVSLPVVVSSGDQIIGMGIWSGGRSSTADAVLHIFVDEAHPDADRAIDHILVESAVLGDVGRVRRFNLNVPSNQTRTMETVLRRGFHLQNNAESDSEIEFTRIVINGPVVPSDWTRIANDFYDQAGLGLARSMSSFAELENTGVVMSRRNLGGTWTMSLFEYETFVSPGTLIAPGRGAVIIPITALYADELLPEARDQKSLVFQHDAALRLERAYFRKASMDNIVSRGTIIIFYVSGKRNCAVALARVTYCQTVTTTQAASNLVRQGVLSAEELRQRSDQSGRIAVVTFDNVLAFPKFVCCAELKTIACVGDANFVTAQPIPYDALCRIVEMAFGGK